MMTSCKNILYPIREIFHLHKNILANFIIDLSLAAAINRGTQGNKVNAFLSFKDFNMIFISGFSKVFIKWVFVAQKCVATKEIRSILSLKHPFELSAMLITRGCDKNKQGVKRVRA